MEDTTNDVRQRAADDLEQIGHELSERTAEIRDAVANYVDANPLAAVGIAFGVGYMLSGALVSRTTLKLATVGGRYLIGSALKQMLLGVGPGLLFGGVFGGRESGDQLRGNGNANRSM